jgi:hypothetical protein
MLNRALTIIRQRHRRGDRLKAKAAAVIDAMRQGQALHCRHERDGVVWWLSKDGQRIGDEVAQLIIANPAIASVGDALFADALAQTWRYVE